MGSLISVNHGMISFTDRSIRSVSVAVAEHLGYFQELSIPGSSRRVHVPHDRPLFVLIAVSLVEMWMWMLPT